MLLLSHGNAQFKHTEQQTRQNQLKLSDRILLLHSVFEQSGAVPSPFLLLQRLPHGRPSEGNVAHNVPCY